MTYEWIEPVFDRTPEDVINARNAQENTADNKGALNYEDLNRIENNYKYLDEMLHEDAIYIPRKYRNFTERWVEGTEQKQETYTEWQERNIPYKSEIDRIRKNYNNLVQIYLKNMGLPILEYTAYVLFDEVNDWERIAYEAKKAFARMKETYKWCGTQTSGSDSI